MKRAICFCLLILAAAGTAAAQYYFDYPKYSRFEAGIFGFGWRAAKNGNTDYSDSWRDRLLLRVYEQTLISSKPSLGAGAGASFALYFNRTLGIEVLLETSSSSLSTAADSTDGWTWEDLRTIRHEASWPGSGRLDSTRISLNVANRFSNLRRAWTLSGGLAAFRNTFSADSWFGFGVSKMSDDGQFQLMDILKVGLRVPQTSWWALGADLGAGLTLKLSDRLGLKVEARGFYCPLKMMSWSFVQGSYDGVFYGQIRGEPFGADSVEFVTNAGTLSTFDIKASCLRLGIGLTWSSVPVVEY
jgi:opacity protein-like surface antigen